MAAENVEHVRPFGRAPTQLRKIDRRAKDDEIQPKKRQIKALAP
jgi:hypothetical protein